MAAVTVSAILATAVVFHDQVMLNIFSSVRRNMVDATLEQSCIVSVTDWKHAVLGFPAHHFDNCWIVTIPTVLLSAHLFEAIYATDEDIRRISGIPAKEQDDDTAPSGISAEVQNGPTIEQSNGKKLLTGKWQIQ